MLRLAAKHGTLHPAPRRFVASSLRRSPRRGFTLIELMVAGIIVALIWGAVTTSLHQLSRARSSSALQLQATLRADAALSELRKNIVSVIRSDDLYWTRLLILDGGGQTPAGWFDRDEIALFNVRLRPVRNRDYIGDGMEFETQYRIIEDEVVPVLWQRRDPIPDEYPLGGGVATPIVEGLVSLGLEAYDGVQWYPVWDSDITGLPWAVRVTVVASGHRIGENPYDAPMVTLRTIVPIDRVAPPVDDTEEEDEEAGDEGEEGADDGSGSTPDANSPGGTGVPGGFTVPPPGPATPGGREGGRRRAPATNNTNIAPSRHPAAPSSWRWSG
jgi:prepilin-type N-terminal cleavage/methylation domain-containing protein